MALIVLAVMLLTEQGECLANVIRFKPEPETEEK
jgi:hypothetical protein